MNPGRPIALAAVVMLIISILAGAVSAAPAWAQQATPPPTQRLLSQVVESEVLSALAENSSADYIIVMEEQADLSAAYLIEDWDERGRYVYETLKATAERSQAPVLEELDRRGVAYQSFIAGNEIYVFGGDGNTLQSMVQIEGVGSVRAPVEVTLTRAFTLPQVGPQPQSEIQGIIPWNITDSGAAAFWATNNQRGEGIRVANIDTGVQYDHPALLGSYRCAGGDAGSPACWFDPTGLCPAGLPCDNHGHGTHTMGTMVGSSNPALAYNVGMAPGAQWIACKGCAGNNCADVTLRACADWILAPGGDSSNRPHVVNNSWGGPGGNTWFLQEVNAWRAAGIFPVFAAGNSGPGCGTIGSPADYQASFAVANHQEGRSIYPDSSRGPGAFGYTPYTKPNLSAPGSGVISTIPINAWGLSSGTSMAAPHVAAAVALLWACSADLRAQIDSTFQLLQNNADVPAVGTCGAPPSGQGNYTYGYGYLDVLDSALGRCRVGTLSGTVRNQHTGLGIPGARVTVTASHGLQATTLTNSSGFYQLRLSEEPIQISVSSGGFLPATASGVSITNNTTTTRDFTLTPLPPRAWLPLVRK